MTMENWNDILTACLRSTANPVLSLVFLISWIFMGNYVLLNLFLGPLIGLIVIAFGTGGKSQKT